MRGRPRATRPLLALMALAPWACPLAAAQPVLHEPVHFPRLRCEAGICEPEGAWPDALPEAVLSHQGLIRPPSLSPSPAEGEQVLRPVLPAAGAGDAGRASEGAGALRRMRVVPDRSTLPERPGGRRYHEVFNPAVFPFKRMTALDAVSEDEALQLRDPSLHPLDVEGKRLMAGRDPFFASVVVELVRDQPVAIPSPAAGVRLLSCRLIPDAPARFWRDSADNLYVEAKANGRHRLVLLMDAEQRYFAGPLIDPETPFRPRLRDVQRAERASLPARLRRHAELVLRHIGLEARPGDDYLRTLFSLVSYFRSFTSGPLVESRGSLYLDLALERRGACRHRSYAFVITALGAGIPARYVENELHVFVEVYIPVSKDKGYFRRVNLGGAPLDQVVLNAEDKLAYRERGQDPFPQPEEFVSGHPRSVSGLGVVRPDLAPARGRPSTDAGLPAREAPPPRGPLLQSQVVVGLGPGTPRSIYRGQMAKVEGTVRVQGGSAGGLDVLLFLEPRGRGQDLIPLGRAITDAEGRYQAEVEIPGDAPLGDHRLVARVRGDETRRGSSSSSAISVP